MHTYTFDDTHTHTFDDADILQKTKLRKRYQVGLEKLRSSAGQVCFVCLWLQFKAQLQSEYDLQRGAGVFCVPMVAVQSAAAPTLVSMTSLPANHVAAFEV